MEAILSALTARTVFHLVSLKPSTTIDQFVSDLLKSIKSPPLFIAKPLKWLIPTTKLAPHLLETSWDLFIAFRAENEAITSLSTLDGIAKTWSINAAAPIPMLESYAATTAALANAPAPPTETLLTRQSGEHSEDELELTLSPELEAWAHAQPDKPVSMMNLLAYEAGKRENYMGYIGGFYEAFVTKGIAAPKLFGTVANSKEGYEDVGLVHYPNAKCFTDMLGSEEYAVLDRKWKVGTVKENGLLCIEEIY